MPYLDVASISREISELVPLYRDAMGNGQWPFLSDDRFAFDDGLARILLPAIEDVETLEALISFL